jgi:hypothetical protein
MLFCLRRPVIVLDWQWLLSLHGGVLVYQRNGSRFRLDAPATRRNSGISSSRQVSHSVLSHTVKRMLMDESALMTLLA